MTALPSAVSIREVGPRDGLQVEEPIEVADRVRLIAALVNAGVQEIEVAAFVSPKAVPAMAGAADVMANLDRAADVSYLALVPNVKGAEMALAARVDGLTFTLSASPAYNERNVNMTIDQSLSQLAAICRLARGIWVDAVISCAFGSPYEGEIPASFVGTLHERVIEAGATSVTLADTTGMATPRLVNEVVAVVGSDIRLHLHETRGTALLNAYAAMELGIAAFDTSIGGLGGSPFATGAGGNLATEDLVHLLQDEGIQSGIDLTRLLEASRLVSRLVGRLVPSRIASAGPRWQRVEPS